MKHGAASTRLVGLSLFGTLHFVTSALLRQAPHVNTVHEVAAGTPLPPNAKATLSRVAREVKALPVPGTSVENHTVPVKTGGTATCTFLGGLAVAEISSQCCTNVQVVTQRHLDEYGMASACKPGWECEADGIAPVAAFETRSLSALCGEPGCLTAVVAAVKRNPVTAGSTDEIGGICSTLSSLGGAQADPQVVSEILSGGRIGKGGGRRKAKRGKKKGTSSKPSCFPGVATVRMQGAGDVPLAKVKVGDEVLVHRDGQIVYEPILAFIHVVVGTSLPFVTVKHDQGSFRASSTHIVFVSLDDSGMSWSSKLVGDLRVGEKVYAAGSAVDTLHAQPSEVRDIRHGSTTSGMFAPLTSSGTIVVDGVVASNYASPSEQKQLPHWLAHAFFSPVRLYHRLGLGCILRRLWPGDTTEHAAGSQSEGLHPYLRVMWQGFKFDRFLASK